MIENTILDYNTIMVTIPSYVSTKDFTIVEEITMFKTILSQNMSHLDKCIIDVKTIWLKVRLIKFGSKLNEPNLNQGGLSQYGCLK